MLGFGWCHIRSSREAYRTASLADVDKIDDLVDRADELLWADFRKWIEANTETWLVWQFHEHLNNHHGLLTYCVSRNHRSSRVWEMLQWIAEHGHGSYGLFYCHDDEDTMERNAYGRNPPMDYSNVYQVHRLMNGQITELNDPFFGMIQGNIDPVDPMNRSSNI
jgi:hypothetical protein